MRLGSLLYLKKILIRFRLPQEYLEKFLDIDYVTAIYERLLLNNKGNGYVMDIEGHSHCIAFWDKARNFDLNDMAEIICIHSLPNNWRNRLLGMIIPAVICVLISIIIPDINQFLVQFFIQSAFQNDGHHVSHDRIDIRAIFDLDTVVLHVVAHHLSKCCFLRGIFFLAIK